MTSRFIKYIQFKFNTAIKAQFKWLFTLRITVIKSIHINRHTVQIQFCFLIRFESCELQLQLFKVRWILNGCQSFYCLSAEKWKWFHSLSCFRLLLIKGRLLFSKKYCVCTQQRALLHWKYYTDTHRQIRVSCEQCSCKSFVSRSFDWTSGRILHMHVFVIFAGLQRVLWWSSNGWWFPAVPAVHLISC